MPPNSAHRDRKSEFRLPLRSAPRAPGLKRADGQEQNPGQAYPADSAIVCAPMKSLYALGLAEPACRHTFHDFFMVRGLRQDRHGQSLASSARNRSSRDELSFHAHEMEVRSTNFHFS